MLQHLAIVIFLGLSTTTTCLEGSTEFQGHNTVDNRIDACGQIVKNAGDICENVVGIPEDFTLLKVLGSWGKDALYSFIYLI